VAVESRVEILEIPTLQESAAGKLPAWTEVGRSTCAAGRRAWTLAAGVFTSEAASFKPLAAMRIGLGAVLLAQAQVLWAYRDLLLNPIGPVPWALSDTWIDPWIPEDVRTCCRSSRDSASAPMRLVATVLGVLALGAAFLMVGYRSRLAAFWPGPRTS
jgi:hypothetical protein